MEYKLHSYRFSQEIIQHSNYVNLYNEIIHVVTGCPSFIFPNKSTKNKKLVVVQQLLNTYFDRRLVCDLGWDYHPNATSIPNSLLAADYRKDFNGLRIQAEIQFGNMARWYSDIFKFQTAYSQGLIDMGLCIVPLSVLGSQIDSNVTNFERCVRELPSAKLSITLPILIIGVEEGSTTPKIDVSKSEFKNIKDITGKGNIGNKYRIVNGVLNNVPIENINITSDTGPIASFEEDPDTEPV